MDLVQVIALSMGIAWASGINLYAAIAMLGILGATGHMTLPPGLETLTEPVVIAAAVFMYCVEFFADKVPGVDTSWDAVHTFLRIPAGAVLAAMAVGDVSVPAQIAAGLIGGTLTASTHATKAGARVLINTSPEPVTNWGASLAEDVAVIAGLWVALNYPWDRYPNVEVEVSYADPANGIAQDDVLLLDQNATEKLWPMFVRDRELTTGRYRVTHRAANQRDLAGAWDDIPGERIIVQPAR